MEEKNKKEKTRGFVTIATGDIRYYEMAANLLQSYRMVSKTDVPFAIIAEERNEYTDQFDDLIIVENPYRSFMDKIYLLKYVPYNETIFIDADSLVYKDINNLWNLIDDKIGVFSAVGEELPLDSKNGWFKQNGIGEYADKISYIAHLHGGLYFIRNNMVENIALLNRCLEIIDHYDEYSFKMFTKPADEPVFALAMSINNIRMIPYNPEIMCFYPSCEYFTSDIRKHEVSYRVSWIDEKIENPYIVHWSNEYTKAAVYKREIIRMQSMVNERYAEWKIICMYYFWLLIDYKKKVIPFTKERLVKMKNLFTRKPR